MNHALLGSGGEPRQQAARAYSATDKLRAMADDPAPFVWVFNTATRPFPGGVFARLDVAEAWIATHRLSGVLTRYPRGRGLLRLGGPRRPDRHEGRDVGAEAARPGVHRRLLVGVAGPRPLRGWSSPVARRVTASGGGRSAIVTMAAKLASGGRAGGCRACRFSGGPEGRIAADEMRPFGTPRKRETSCGTRPGMPKTRALGVPRPPTHRRAARRRRPSTRGPPAAASSSRLVGSGAAAVDRIRSYPPAPVVSVRSARA